MRYIGATICLLCVSVNAAGNVRKLRGQPITPPLQPASSQYGKKAGLGPDPGPIGEKPRILKDAEAFHDEWIRPVASLKNFVLANWSEVIVSATIWIVFVLVVAFFYKRSARYIPETGNKPLDSIESAAIENELSDWNSEWYQCYRYPEIFFWSCCCPCIRWAHTMDLLQFLDYWPAFLVFFLLEIMNQLSALIFFGFFLTMILAFYRQKMRKLFGMENYATCTGLTMDCLGFCFCWPCFLAQEANHITQAAKLGWTKDLAVKTGLFSARLEPPASQEG